MRLTPADREVLRKLASEWAEVAALPVQKQTKQLWSSLNDLAMQRPMVMIDQLPWHELNQDGSLTTVCEDPYWKRIETDVRRTLFKWRHFPGDMVVEPFLRLPLALEDTGYGIEKQQETLRVDEASDVLSQAYKDLLGEEGSEMAIVPPVLTLLPEENARREAEAHELFDGILETRLSANVECMFNAWDFVSQLRSLEAIFIDLMDRPEHLHNIMRRVTAAFLSRFEQYEALGLLEYDQPLIHCTGATTSQLPKEGTKVRMQDVWVAGMAQLFSSVSIDMHEEFELTYIKQVFSRFGLGYYGCCEPLHQKIGIISQVPHVRKISISPWADVDISAEAMGGKFVLSRKPNPAFLATTYSADQIEKELRDTLTACKRNGTPCELILKDVSTIGYDLSRLTRWQELAMRLVQA